MRAAAWLFTFLVAGMTGCLSPDDGSPPPGQAEAPFVPGPPTEHPDFDFSAAIEVTHDHSAVNQHRGSFELDLVAFDPITSASAPGMLAGGYTEVSLAGDFAVVANWGPHRGFSIVDISDPRAPRHVSDFLSSEVADPTRAGAQSDWDVHIFPEGDLVVLSAQALANLPTAPGEVGGGLYLVNVSDKSAPFLESFTPILDAEALIPVGVHNARGFTLDDGRRFVAASTANGAAHVLEVVGEAPARTLKQASIVPGMHDTAVQRHPLTGALLLYGTQGGVFITDMEDPYHPEILSSIPNGEDLSAYHQFVPNDVLMQGRHYAVASTEDSEGLPTPFTVIDTTDPTVPFVVAEWTLPIEPQAPHGGGPYRFSGHNLDVSAGRMYIGHYHAGVWIVDFTDIGNGAAPFPVAYHEPAPLAVTVPRTAAGADVPMVWSVIRHTDGHIYAADVNTGLHVLGFTGQPSPWEDAARWTDNTR